MNTNDDIEILDYNDSVISKDSMYRREPLIVVPIRAKRIIVENKNYDYLYVMLLFSVTVGALTWMVASLI